LSGLEFESLIPPNKMDVFERKLRVEKVRAEGVPYPV